MNMLRGDIKKGDLFTFSNLDFYCEKMVLREEKMG